ncbi:GTP-binding protein [Methylomagnum ishizawai]|uniref:GTP-binding protein n=1 Tax=Methylomagnum ishizawai TaxID=1760988 RepID=UPI001C3285ED|nr:ATP/GTP-binding protein [Methylomagnum ishizawai]BBL75677.1 GTP-binding protein [Methylomagnum ishizawai]
MSQPPKGNPQIKLVFTGSVGAGKTTAISVISEVPPIMTEARPSDDVAFRKNSTTVAMDYGELTLEGGIKLNLYGTPGQRRFDFMCHILTKGALGLIVLINNAHPTPLDELDYYLNLNADFLKDRPAVIGVTHLDEAATPGIEEYYQCLAERGEYWPVLKADARSRDDVTILVNALLSVLEFG